jgi:hypothetical protein
VKLVLICQYFWRARGIADDLDIYSSTIGYRVTFMRNEIQMLISDDWRSDRATLWTSNDFFRRERLEQRWQGSSMFLLSSSFNRASGPE